LRLCLPQATATTNHFDNPSLSADDSSSSTTYDIDTTEVLVQLGGASIEELELQIIYDTIMLQGAVSA
jgi:hypothetical protein